MFLDPERLKTHREAPVTCWATADGAVQPKKVGFMNGCTTRWVKGFFCTKTSGRPEEKNETEI